MKKVFHHKSWRTGVVQIHEKTPPIISIKSETNAKSEKDYVEIKLHGDPTSEKSGLYEFKMALFGNGDPGGFLLFVRNFQMTLKASVALNASTRMQYLCTLLCVQALHRLDTFSVELGSTTTKTLN